ncbi:peptidase domain-containing ABC transporter [Mangrovibacillus sp. Mu-81]|uniref:peptidase domain-containing ABC transporter n=1 Tax=Mangrovibacillus sp. Mu-81 TaxID=3121478 RepID=UPI002FE4B94D
MKKKIPFIEQMSQTECGLACVAMVSGYYDKHIPLFDLRDRVGNGRDGNTLYDLYKVSQDLGFEAKCFKLAPDQLPLAELPVILYWDAKHFVVLEKITKKGYILLDPAHGRKKMMKDEFLQHYSGYILSLTPGEDFVPQKEKSLWKPYLKMLAGRPKILGMMLLFNVILQLFVLITPMFTQRIIDNMLLDNQAGLLSLFLQGILITFGSYFIFNLLRNEVSIRMFKYLDYEMSWEYFSHILKIPYSFFQVRQSGDLLYRFSNLRSIRQILSNQIMKSLLDFVLLIVILGYMIYESIYLASYLIGFTVILYLFIFAFRPLMHEMNRDELTKDTKLYSYQTESIMGVLNIKIAGAEKVVSKKWLNLYSDFAGSFIKKERVFGFINSFSGGLTYFMPLAVIWIGAPQVMSGSLSLGELVAFQSIATFFISTSNSLIFQVETFYQLKVYLRRIRDVVDTPAEYDESISYEKKELEGNITFKDVCFSYTKYADPVIKNINLDIQAGEKIAIIGASGSGKSTLANLLVGLHVPTEGEILYDGVSLAGLDKSHTRNQMGIVNQEPFLFNQSIFENIKSQNEHLREEDIVRAAMIAQIHDEIMAIPMKYETVISEQGQNFSGGQKQRIAIARALAPSPRILVLDEATNSLDSINEKKIDEVLTSMKCTRIVIAHRLSTIQNADKIVVLHDGQIAAQGSHEELMASDPYYQSLFETNESLDLKGGEKHEQRIKSVEEPVL